ncbi:hypothetical protein JQX13_29255 [Archangium violaceum]|uniref:hypothetical protein n=1 Tax=Archangium violaceum TaxID=83451 RepID=UPI00193C0CD6|nr:hypothetical protein [Archangium violaceum]QRK04348.1 hypothetical protein JQX13_29255 [Archangium violaceum]
MSLIFTNTQAKNGQKTTIDFGQNVLERYAVLAGFDTSFGGDDHEVKTIKASVDFPLNNNLPSSTLEVTANVSITDDSGHSGGGTLYIMGMGRTKEDGCQFKQQTWKPGDSELKVTIDKQPAPMDNAWVFIKGFQLSYGKKTDHHVQTLSVDAGNSTLSLSSVKDTTGDSYSWTIIFKPNLVMNDNSGNGLSNDSFLDLVVMAAPVGATSSQARVYSGSPSMA